MNMIPLFQSLFLWNSRPDDTTNAKLFVAAGFNPCFCGTRARTVVLVLKNELLVGFQSLFLWNSRPDSEVPKIPVGST